MRERKREKRFPAVWQTPGELQQHTYKYRKRKSLHWQVMRHQGPITVSMQSHWTTKNSFSSFHTYIYTSTRTLLLGLGATILKAEGLGCVLLCPCQVAKNWRGHSFHVFIPTSYTAPLRWRTHNIWPSSYNRFHRMPVTIIIILWINNIQPVPLSRNLYLFI